MGAGHQTFKVQTAILLFKVVASSLGDLTCLRNLVAARFGRCLSASSSTPETWCSLPLMLIPGHDLRPAQMATDELRKFNEPIVSAMMHRASSACSSRTSWASASHDPQDRPISGPPQAA